MFSLAGIRQSVNSAVILNLIQSDEEKKSWLAVWKNGSGKNPFFKELFNIPLALLVLCPYTLMLTLNLTLGQHFPFSAEINCCYGTCPTSGRTAGDVLQLLIGSWDRFTSSWLQVFHFCNRNKFLRAPLPCC